MNTHIVEIRKTLDNEANMTAQQFADALYDATFWAIENVAREHDLRGYDVVSLIDQFFDMVGPDSSEKELNAAVLKLLGAH